MEPAPRAGRRRSRAAGLRRERPSLHSSSGSRRPRTRPCTRPAAGEEARARAGAAAGAASSRKAAGATGGPRSAVQRPAAPAPLPARGGGAEPAGLSFPAARASRLPPGSPAPSLARSLALSRPPLFPPPPPPPPTRRPAGTPLLAGAGTRAPKPITGRLGGRPRAAGAVELCPHAHRTPPAGLPVAPRGSRRGAGEAALRSLPTPLRLSLCFGEGADWAFGDAEGIATRNTQHSVHSSSRGLFTRSLELAVIFKAGKVGVSRPL